MRHVDHGVLAVGEGGPVEARLAALHLGLAQALDEHRPQIVAIEEVFHARNSRSALVLGQARGVALLAAAQAGALVRSFAPSTIKQAVTGTGRAEKEQMAVHAKRTSLEKGYLVSPPTRAWRSNGSMTSRRPSHATMPRI